MDETDARREAFAFITYLIATTEGVRLIEWNAVGQSREIEAIVERGRNRFRLTAEYVTDKDPEPDNYFT